METARAAPETEKAKTTVEDQSHGHDHGHGATVASGAMRKNEITKSDHQLTGRGPTTRNQSSHGDEHAPAKPIKDDAPTNTKPSASNDEYAGLNAPLSLPPKNSTSSSSLPLPPQRQQLLLDEGRIEKAEAFLRKREIRDVPTSDKRRYLGSKAGLTPDEIDAALDRVARIEGMGMAGTITTDKDKDDITKNQRQSRQSSQRGDYNNNNYNSPGPNPNPQRHGEHDRYGDRQGSGGGYDGRRSQNPNQYNRNNDDPYGNPRRGPMPDRRQYDSGNSNMPPYNTQSAQGSMEREEPTSSSFLPAWAGGFSLGVLCLAAIRWLNGGDFELFPSPTASESRPAIENTLRSKKEDGPLVNRDEEDANNESDSQQQEEDEVQAEEEEEYEEESVDEDEDLQKILNGTANAQNIHPDNSKQQQQPSYDELVLEIRALTSAIHSYRDVQERANRAVTAKAGKGLTDDAMDFLRQKKTEEVPSSQSSEDGKVASSLEEREISTISSFLNEVSGDLSQLKQCIILQEDKDGGESAQLAGDADDNNEPTKDEKGEVEIDEPSKQIDKVTEKIKKMLDIIDKKEERESKATDAKNENDDNGSSGESKSTSEELTAAGTPPHSVHTDDEKTQPSENPPQAPNDESAKADEQQQQLEDAIKTLASSNIADELKVGAQMLYLYCLNISKNPSVPRYRKIYTNNNTFRKKVGNLVGAKEFLSAVGFEKRANMFEWTQSDDASTKARLDFALVALEMMKNGTKPNDDDTLISASDSKENDIAAAAEIPLSTVLSVPGVGKGIDLN